MVPPHSHGIPRVPQYSGNNLLDSDFGYMTFTFSGQLSQTVFLSYPMHDVIPNPIRIASNGLASFPFARHYSENLG